MSVCRNLALSFVFVNATRHAQSRLGSRSAALPVASAAASRRAGDARYAEIHKNAIASILGELTVSSLDSMPEIIPIFEARKNLL